MSFASKALTAFLCSGIIQCLNPVFALQEHWAETSMLAKVAIETHHPDQAKKLYLQALKEAETFGEDDPRLTASLRDTADCFIQFSNDFALPEQLLKREQKILRRLGPDFPGLVAGLDLSGRNYYNHGRYKEAEKSFQDGIKISLETFGGATNRDWRHELEARLAQCYRAEGQYDQAERCMQSVLSAAKAAKDGVTSLYYPYHALAILYYDMKRYDDAIVYANQCLAVTESAPKWEGYCLAKSQALMIIGEAYARRKKNGQALNYLRQSVIFARPLPASDDSLLHVLYPPLANAELAAGNYADARAAANQALAIAKKRGDTALAGEISAFLATNNSRH